MFQRFMNPTLIYTRRIQQGLEEARMAALEHESAAEHHAALAHMYRERVHRLQMEMSAVTSEAAPQGAKAEATPGGDEGVESSAAAQVHRITPRGAKRDDGAAGPGLMPQGIAG